MNIFVTFETSLPQDELRELSRIAKESGVVVSAFPKLREMELDTLIHERIVLPEPTKMHALLDANFVAKLLELLRHRSDVPSEQHRSVAAIMALSITFGIEINPTVAVYEYACTALDDPEERLVRFYYANHLKPDLYADVAFGRQRSLPIPSPQDLAVYRHCGSDGMKKPVKSFSIHHAGALAILAIHTSPELGRKTREGCKRRMLRFLDWMYNDGIFAPCFMLAAHDLWGCLPGNSIIKNADTHDVAKLLASAKNAAWDLSLAHVWSDMEVRRKPGDGSAINLFYTLDKSLRFIANFLLQTDAHDETNLRELLNQEANQFWQPQHAAEIMDRYFYYQAHREDAHRRCNRPSPDPVEAIEQLTKQIGANLARSTI